MSEVQAPALSGCHCWAPEQVPLTINVQGFYIMADSDLGFLISWDMQKDIPVAVTNM